MIQELIDFESWIRTRIGLPPLAGATGGSMPREFRNGDKVKVVAGDYNITRVGTTWVVDQDQDKHGTVIVIAEGGKDMRFWLPAENLALVSKTLETFEVGDQVEKTSDTINVMSNTTYGYSSFSTWGSESKGDKRTVLAALSPGVYAMSKTGAQDQFGEIMTAKDLERKGYTVVGAEPENVEMTVAEVEEKLGITNLRIKKEAA